MNGATHQGSGRFLAIEGIDGSGKSGIVRFLAAELTALGHDVVTTREPGGTPEGEALRALLLGEAGKAWDLSSELLLMTAARVQHLHHVIAPAVARGAIVISDRFVGSTIAYQGAGRGIPAEHIRDLHATFIGGTMPHLTIVLDVDVATGLSRSKRRLAAQSADEGRFEALDTSFHERVRASFLTQAAADPARHAVLDATRTPDEVAADALAAVRDFLER